MYDTRSNVLSVEGNPILVCSVLTDYGIMQMSLLGGNF